VSHATVLGYAVAQGGMSPTALNVKALTAAQADAFLSRHGA
jgi:hypothetical protein